MNTYRLVKIVPAASLAAALKLEKHFPVEESYLDKEPPTMGPTAIGFRIANSYDD